MKIFKEIVQGIVALLMIVCVFAGLFLMLCECEDMKKQVMVLFIGFGLFLLGVTPGLIVGLKEWRVNR